MQMKLLKAFVSSAAVIFSVASVYAADANGKFAVRGVGTTSCSELKGALADPGRAGAYAQWILGYLSASNRNVAQTFDMLPTPQGSDMLAVVGAVCKSQPSLAVEAATFQAIRALAPLHIAKESPFVAVNNGSTTVQIRSDALLLLQNALVRKKFLKGPATGQPNPDVIKAIKAFQEKEGLAGTGLPNIDTFVRAVIKP